MAWLHWLGLLPYFPCSWLLLARGSPWKSSYHRLAFCFPLTFALATALPLLISNLFSGFATCYWSGAAIATLGFFCLNIWRPKWDSKSTWTLKISCLSVLALLWLVFLSILVAIIALKYAFHDQLRVQAHPAVIESVLRGNYPPHLQTFPQIPLKYHFGSDMLGASFAYAFSLPAYRAIDLIQILGWIAGMAAIYSFCRERSLPPLLAFFGIHWLLLAAGWAYLLKPWLGGIDFSPNWPDNYVIFGRYLNPGVISYFFQTPYCIGLPVFFMTLMMIFRACDRRSRWDFVLAIFCLGILSIFQVSLFFSSCVSFAALWTYRRFKTKQAWSSYFFESAFAGLGTVGLALLLGGFFNFSESYSKGLLILNWPLGYLRYAAPNMRQTISGIQSLLWYFSSMGSLIVIFPIILILGLRRAWKSLDYETIFFGAFASLCFLMPQLFRYRLSWDIIKWFTGFQLASVLSILVFFSRSYSGKFLASLWILPFLLVDTIPSYYFLTSLAMVAPSHWPSNQTKWTHAVNPPLSPDLKQLNEILRNSKWNEPVLTTPRGADVLSFFSGQSMAIIDYNTEAFGVLPSLIKERKNEIQESLKNFNLNTVRSMPIFWIIFPCSDFQSQFSEDSKAYINRLLFQGELQEMHISSNACWRVLRISENIGASRSF